MDTKSSPAKPTSSLGARHLSAEAARAGWRRSQHAGLDGWQYPLYSLDGSLIEGVTRWKNAGSEGPKYAWEPAGSNGRPKYYVLPGLREAIEKAGGVIHLASGEPDVLTLRAAGRPNVLCWFGECNVPDTLADDLLSLGVKRAVFWPDMDTTGMRAAEKVWGALRDRVLLEIRLIPGQKVSESAGYDLNKLWQAAQGDQAVFWEALKAAPAWEPPPSTGAPPADDHDRAGELEEVERRVRQIIAQRLVKRGGKKDVYECPLEHGPDGKDFYYALEGPIGGCQGKHAGELTAWKALAEHLGIDVTAIARDVALERRKPAAVQTSGKPPSSPTPEGPPPIPVISSTTALFTIGRLLTGEEVTPSEPILSPYSVLRKFGGNLQLWEPRTVVLIISAPGMGKTAFIETCQDGHRREGEDYVMWGPEWTAAMYQMRAIRSLGGPSVELQRLHHLWKAEEARSVAPDQRHGKPLLSGQQQKVQEAIAQLQAWPGRGYYLDRTGSLPAILARAGEVINARRAEGRRVVAMYLDYIQKFPRGGSHWAELEFMIGQVAQFAIDYDVVGVIVSQTNKGGAARVRAGSALDDDAAQQLSTQQCNAAITLNPVYSEGSREEEAWIRCVKNSWAPYPAKLRVKTALWRHRWTDEAVGEVVGDNFSHALFVDDEDAPPEVNLPSWNLYD